MTPPPWPNSKTQVPFEAKGLVRFPELGSADPVLPCPLLSHRQGRHGRGLLWAVPPATSSVYLVPASLSAWSSFLGRDFRLA